jgi:hypothetical protein
VRGADGVEVAGGGVGHRRSQWSDVRAVGLTGSSSFSRRGEGGRRSTDVRDGPKPGVLLEKPRHRTQELRLGHLHERSSFVRVN